MQIVESILKGAVATQVAKANDLHPEVVRKWVRDFKAYQKDAFAGRGKAYTDNAKVGELERQLGQRAARSVLPRRRKFREQTGNTRRFLRYSKSRHPKSRSGLAFLASWTLRSTNRSSVTSLSESFSLIVNDGWRK